jgi:mitochondrial fission protein ELM1
MENQCVGLSEALGLRCEVRRVRRPANPICLLHPRLWPNPLSTVGHAERWPDVVISSGRGSVAAALAIRRANSPRTFNIHIQSPYVHPSSFDVVVIPQHDALRGSNVLVTKTALHRVTEARLLEAAEQFSEQLAHLPRPLIAVLVGGANKTQECSPIILKRLGELLLSAARQCGGSLAVTTSRRTGRENEDVLRECLSAAPLFFWSGADENPYFGLLALADAIVVTNDSVSMVSEACATGKPVHVFNLGPSHGKLHRFHQSLLDAGVTRPFEGRLEQWSYDPPRETQRVAEIIWERIRDSRHFMGTFERYGKA